MHARVSNVVTPSIVTVIAVLWFVGQTDTEAGEFVRDAYGGIVFWCKFKTARMF